MVRAASGLSSLSISTLYTQQMFMEELNSSPYTWLFTSAY